MNNKTRGKKGKKQPKPKGGPSKERMRDYLAVIKNPSAGLPVHIPDNDTTPSGLLTTDYEVKLTPTAISGTSTNHSFALWCPPFPDMWVYAVETVAGGGTLCEFTTTAGIARNTIFSNSAVPNYTGFMGTASARVRCVAMEVDITYLGTELNRSGRIVAGLAPITSPGAVVATTGTQYSSFATTTGTATCAVSTLINSLSEQTTRRIMGTHKFIWKPASAPSYQIFDYNGLNRLAYSGSAGVAPVNPNYLFAPANAGGVQAGQNALVIIVAGDTTSAAAAASNSYDAKFTMHWEVVPADDGQVVYSQTVSSVSGMFQFTASYAHRPFKLKEPVLLARLLVANGWLYSKEGVATRDDVTAAVQASGVDLADIVVPVFEGGALVGFGGLGMYWTNSQPALMDVSHATGVGFEYSTAMDAAEVADLVTGESFAAVEASSETWFEVFTLALEEDLTVADSLVVGAVELFGELAPLFLLA